MDFLDRTKDFLGPDARDRAFAQFHLFLMDTKDIASLEKFYVHVRQGEDERKSQRSNPDITHH